MIIGVSGYSGSGKDTVGQLIQQLTAQERYGYLENTWEIKKWAGKLKTIASLLTGISEINFEDQEFKKTNLGPEWNKQVLYDSDAKWIVEGGEMHEEPMTVREFLQKLGTDGLRDGLHSNVWVNALMADYIEQYNIDTDRTTWPNWIITDTRFPNEAEAIKKAGGIIIRVDRPGVKPTNNHPSETSLDNWEFDYKIMNISDIEALRHTVHTILKKENII
jgi:hypothetical protein